ncbi:MAG: hypothetical protein IJ362_02380 [Oscillospiraceae bacterium]|nr:hypothetical protein [Oscillospiraceae bacterium]
MKDIWGFLNQSLQLSSMAVIILALKFIFRDKLSARWQYGVWSVLAVCIFIPAGYFGGYILPWLHFLLQAYKVYVQQNFSRKITDILFMIYIAGVALYIIRYIVGYIRLKMLISAADTADTENAACVKAVADRYNLQVCDIKIITGLPSAFVFGLFNPVLALPADRETDEKVILHELLHLKHKDLWQNIFWALAKAVHWPNPLMQYVFRTIHNDMESLCDYRVMELLAGEDRREYGRILLSMTNDKYPSAFGTTSISNGAHFISERIQAIARFKKYPQGMGMVAGCIVALLFPLAIKGTAISCFDDTRYTDKNSFEYSLAVAKAQLARCTTVDGAIDAYAKSLIFDYDIYGIPALSEKETGQYTLPDISGWTPELYGELYSVVGIQQTDTGSYTANLMLKKFIKGDNYGTEYYLIPIEITQEDGWRVHQTADYRRIFVNTMDYTSGPPNSMDYSGIINIEYDTAYGKLKITGDTIWYRGYDEGSVPMLNAEFPQKRAELQTWFELDESCFGFGCAAIATGALKDMADSHNTDEMSQGMLGNQTIVMSSSDGYSMNNTVFGENFDGILWDSLILEADNSNIPAALQFDLWLGTDHYLSLKINLETGEVYEQNI